MPSCNFLETIHNKWLQQSGNCGNDQFDATVDNKTLQENQGFMTVFYEDTFDYDPLQ
jgi:hypothetical protein